MTSIGLDQRLIAAAQRATLEVLHRDVGGALVLEVLVDGDDVGVVERARDPRFP